MNYENVLIIGAGHGIGLGLVKQISANNIFATYRVRERAAGLLELPVSSHQVDPCDEQQLEQFFKQLPPLQLVISCVGMIATPEKSLRDIDIAKMTEIFRVNAASAALIAKYARTKFNRNETSCLAFLSAMVGSIEDNSLGGWYSYRASKCALNMLVKTIAIEYQRSGLKTKVTAIHPGTTETDLSRDYLGAVKHRIWQPQESAKNILDVIGNLNASGVFKNWDGSDIPW